MDVPHAAWPGGRLRDRVALVTGASRGIGAAIAQALAREGALVVVNYREDQAAAEAVVARCQALGGDAWAERADVTDPAAVQALAEAVRLEAGRLDVLVNNAFAPFRFDPERRARADALDWTALQSQFDGAVRATHQLCQASLPLLRQRPGASIVNLSSNLVRRPVVPYLDYGTAKAALEGYSRTLAAELGPWGIRVNCVAPGLVYPTDASRHTRPEVQDAIVAQTPLRRLATPEDVAGPVLFLASDDSRFMTGQVLVVDGGLVMA